MADESFKALFRVALPLLKVTALTLLPVVGLFTILGFIVTDGVTVSLGYDGIGSEPTGISGFGGAKLFASIPILLLSAILLMAWRLASLYLLYWSNRGVKPSAGDALRATGNRFLRSFGWYLAFGVALTALYLLVALV